MFIKIIIIIENIIYYKLLNINSSYNYKYINNKILFHNIILIIIILYYLFKNQSYYSKIKLQLELLLFLSNYIKPL